MGLINSSINSQLLIYPNPASNVITIQSNYHDLNNEPVEILDLIGKVVYSGELDNNNEVSVVGLKNGFYLVKTKHGISKIVIEK